MARVLIAGCGYVGSQLAVELDHFGHEVWGLRRDVSRLPKSARPVAGDLTRPETLGALPVGVDYVFYTVGAGGGGEDAYRSAYIDGMGGLLDALADQHERPRRVFFTSSTAVYAQRRGEWVDEDSPASPSSYRGDIMLCAERLLHASTFPGTVLRLGGIYGPGRNRMIEAVREGRARVRPGPPHYTNRIHRDDAAGALRHLMAADAGGAELAEIYLGVDEEPAEEGAILGWLAERLGMPPPAEADPDDEPILRRAGSKRCRNDRLLGAGYVFRFPTFREGYAALLADAG